MSGAVHRWDMAIPSGSSPLALAIYDRDEAQVTIGVTSVDHLPHLQMTAHAYLDADQLEDFARALTEAASLLRLREAVTADA